jgi:hypothetical protein
MYNTYESFYNSGSQSWRIKKYGTVCIVADAFLGAVVSSGTGTALTTLAEVRLRLLSPHRGRYLLSRCPLPCCLPLLVPACGAVQQLR